MIFIYGDAQRCTLLSLIQIAYAFNIPYAFLLVFFNETLCVLGIPNIGTVLGHVVTCLVFSMIIAKEIIFSWGIA